MAFIDDLKILLGELRQHVDNHDHYAAEEVVQRLEQLTSDYRQEPKNERT